MTKGPHRGPFFILCVLDEDEDCCSKKRASVLDAAGAPQEVPLGCAPQEVPLGCILHVVRQMKKGPLWGPFVIDL